MGGTLADGGLDKKAFMARVVDYLSGLGFSVDRRAYRRALDSAMRELHKLRASGREPSFERFYSLVLSGLGIEPTGELLAQLKRLYFECFSSEPLPGIRRVLKELSGRYVLAVISNAISPWPRLFLEREGLLRYFRAVVISGEVGWRKPHKRIFEIALGRLGLEAGQVAHVGDSPVDDVAGAKGAGMRAILLLRPGYEAGPWDVEPDAVIHSLSELSAVLEELDP